MKSKRSISILSIVFLLFSMFATPLSVLAENQSDSDFKINIEEKDNALELSWEMEKDEEDVEFEFILIKNGEEKTITEEVTSEELSGNEKVQYTYKDVEVLVNTHYTYQVIKSTEEADLLSNEVEFLIPEVEVTTEEEKPAAEESVVEKEEKTEPAQDKKSEEKTSVIEKSNVVNELAIDTEEDVFIDIDIEDVTHNSITVSWETDTTFEALYIYLDEEPIEEVSSETREFSIEGLESNREYLIEVVGLLEGEKFFSNTMYIVDTEVDPKDMKEVSINVLNENDDVLDDHYDYEFNIEGSEESNEQVYVYGYIDEDGDLLDWEEENVNLLPGKYNLIIYKDGNHTVSKRYEIDIQNDKDYVEHPIQLVFEENEILPQQFNIDVVEVTQHSIHIKWDNLDHVEGYDIEFDYDEVIELDNNTTEYTFDNLESNSTYEIDVAAKLTSGLKVSKQLTVKTYNTEEFAVVKIEDEELERVIKKELGIYLRDITTDDMLELEYLNAFDKGITSLAGLEYATNLESLHLYYNGITDLSPISGLTNLYDLDLDGNEITDVTPLTNLVNLESIELQDNNITNIEPMSGLINLNYVRLGDNEITGVTPLSNLVNLQFLDLYGNKISNIEPISDLIDLYYLQLGDNAITDISPISGLTNLKELYLRENEINDETPLSNLVKLEALDLDYNQINDISVLGDLKKLYRLDLDGNEITNLEPLLDLDYLETLYVYDNPIDDYSVIQTLLDKGVDVYFDSDNSLLVHVVETSNDSITIEWDHKINFGEVDYYNLSIDYETTIKIDGSTTTFTFTDLEPNEPYYIEIEAVYMDEEYDYGYVEAWTGETTNVQLEAINLSNSSDYEFEISAMDEKKYSFYLYGEINQAGKLVDWNGNTTHHMPEGRYQIDVYDYDNYEQRETFIIHIDTNRDYTKEPIQLDFDRVSETVDFKDVNLEKAIRDHLYIYNRKINTIDLENMTELYATNYGISDLSGLEHAVNLSDLYLVSNNLKDISVLENFKYLTELTLWDNNISDISSLAALERLTYLDLDDNIISNLNSLSNLSKLETLYLSYNPITDISNLASLTNLEYVSLYGTSLDFDAPSTQETIEKMEDAGTTIDYEHNLDPTIYSWVNDTSSDSIDIGWMIENNTNVDHIEIYLNGEKVESLSSDEQTYSFESLKSNTLYSIELQAFNIDGDQIAYDYIEERTDRAVEGIEQVSLKAVGAKSSNLDKNLQFSIEGADEDNADIFIYGNTDENGMLITKSGELQLPTGNYEVIIYGNGMYQTTIEDITINEGQNKTIEIIVEELVDETTNVQFKVVDEEGAPVTTIHYVSLYNSDVVNAFDHNAGDYSEWELNNADGVYGLNDIVLANDYQLTIRSDDFITQNQRIDVQQDTELVEVIMEKGATITGKVQDTNGNPLAANYSVYGNETNEYGQTNGQDFSISGLHTENLMVEFHLEGYKTVVKELKEKDLSAENDLGTITLEHDQFVHGKVLKENGDPAANVDVYLHLEDSRWSNYWTSTNEDGYFKIRNVEDGEYTLKTEAYNLPNVTRENITPKSGEYTVVLEEEGTGSFSGEGNGLTASKRTVVPGETIEYRLDFQNNGDATVENALVSFDLHGLYLHEQSVLLDGEKIQLDTREGITLPSIKPGENGTISFKATVADVESDSNTLISSVTIKIGEEKQKHTATSEVLFVTMNAPEVTGSKQVKVYGTAKTGDDVQIDIFDGDILLGSTEVTGKWWNADISLPVSEGIESTHQLIARITEEGTVQRTAPVSISYEPNIPEVTDVNISAGWNENIKVNPHVGVVTSAIIEYTPIDITVEFDGEVDAASIGFLGENYPLSKKDGKYSLTIPGTWSSYGEQMMDLTYTIGEKQVKLPLMEVIVLIDPSGYVFEGSMDNRLEGATAIVEEREQGKSTWNQWDAEFFGQVNPQVTDERGRYGWDVPEGDWRVIFSKEGYETYESRVVQVPPAETQLNVPLIRTSNPEVESVVEKDGVVEINFDRLMNQENIPSGIQIFEGDTLIEGSFEFEDYDGYKETPGPKGYFESDSSKKLSQTVKWTPAKEFKEETTYTVVIDDSIQDYDGKELEENVEKEFTTTVTPVEPEKPGDQDGEEPGDQDSEDPEEQDGNKPGDQEEEKPGDQDGDETGTSGGNDSGTKDEEKNNVTTIKPVIENNKLVFDKSAFDLVENDDVIIIDLNEQKELDIFEIELTEDQVKLLISKNATLQINKNDVRLSIPSSVFTNGSKKVTITIEKLNDIENSLSSVYDFTIKQGNQLISKFEKGITITLKVDKDMVQKAEHVNIYYLNEKNNEWEKIGGSYADGEISATINHFSTFSVFEDTSMSIKIPQGDQESIGENQSKLPETATNIYNMLIISFVLLAAGLILLFVQKRKKA